MHTALIGASRGIGRATALEILSDPSSSVSLLLRSPSIIENDVLFSQAIKSGRVRIVKGDAYEKADIRKLMDDPTIDSIVTSLGMSYNLNPQHMT